MANGTEWSSERKDFGLITPENGGEALLVRLPSLSAGNTVSLQEQQGVSFDVVAVLGGDEEVVELRFEPPFLVMRPLLR